MKKNAQKRGLLAGLGAAVAAVALVLGSSVAASAAQTTIDPNAPVNLNIVKLSTPDSSPLEPTGGLQVAPTGSTPIGGVEFTVREITNAGDLATNAGWQSAAAIQYDSATGVWTNDGAEFVPVFGENLTAVTDATGVPRSGAVDSDGFGTGALAYQDLEIGLYFVEETATPAGVTPAAPFIVALPMTDPVNRDAWLYNVYVYPKNSQVGITKTVSDAPKFQAGTPGALVTWTIEADTPRIPHETDAGQWVMPTSFVISDSIDDRLAPQTVSVVAVDAAGDAITGANALNVDDYTLAPASLPANPGTDVTVTFTSAGLTKLQGLAATFGTQVRVTIETLVVADATGRIENNASVAVNGGEALVTAAPAATEWRNVQFTKVNQNDTGLAGATFNVYDTEANAVAGGAAGIVLGAAVESDSTVPGNVNLGSLIRSDHRDGGVLADIAEYRLYWLVETIAPAGYELLAEPVPFVVLDGGAYGVTVDDSGLVTEVDTEALGQIVNVESSAGFELPLTGGMGTTLLTVSGIAILAIVLLVARRRRNTDEAMASA